MTYDLLIRGGTVVDGLGGEPHVADVAVKSGVIAALGTVDGSAAREIDARGFLVTPGFVDIHTHYDGQAIWSERLNPSSSHGVTTVVVGNCGVGFAPCRPDDHEVLVDVMSGVEDIPGVVMTDGLPWDWETFPEFLDALDSRRHDIDIAAYLPHSPLRVYAMGQRGAKREPATAKDLDRMRALAKEAIEAGALGFASSALVAHKTGTGEQIPTFQAAHDEIAAIAQGVVEGGGGLIQFVPDIPVDGYRPVLQGFFEAARAVGLPLTFSMTTSVGGGPIWREAIELLEEFNRSGAQITAQVFPRPVGLTAGLALTINPFVLYPSYQEIAHLPLPERVTTMRTPAVRERILADTPTLRGHPVLSLGQAWEWMFPLDESPDYEPNPSTSILARARARGVSPEEEAYDRLLDEDGNAILLIAIANFQDHSLDSIGELMRRDDTVLGLGDGGAHYGMICDASYPTYLLSYWTRDRGRGRIDLADAVKQLTSIPARVAGLEDRGRIAVGYKADLNVIDYDGLYLHRPVVKHDLPAGGRRLDQQADGYVATIVSGEAIIDDGVVTQARPGRLVRGRQAAPIQAMS